MRLLFFNLVGLVVQNKIFLAIFWNTVKRKDVLWYKLISIVLIYDRFYPFSRPNSIVKGVSIRKPIQNINMTTRMKR